MGYKMLALDIDGTVLNSQGEITPGVQGAIARATASGLVTTLATGRNWRAALPVAEALGIGVPLVVCNGAQVVCPTTGQVFLQQPLPGTVAAEATRLLQRLGFAVYAACSDPDGPDFLYEQPATLPVLNPLAGQDPSYVRQVFDLAGAVLTRGALKLVVADRTPSIAAVAERLRREVQGEFQVLVMPYPNGYSIMEVARSGVSKATGLERLTALLGISSVDVIAVGDQLNDLEMLTFAGLGVAMGNAREEVKRVAGWVTGTNDQDGVAALLDQFVFQVA